MHEILAFIVFASFLTGTPILVGAALVLVVVILGAALFIFRSSGKKKGTAANKTGAGADWQRQQGQQGQQGAPGAWNQQGMGGAADNAWAQPQQPNAWGAQAPAQQQPGTWGAQAPAQQQPGAWGAQAPAAQQQPNAWGTQAPAQQPNAWETQIPGQQQPAANTWGTPSSPLQQPGAWGAQAPAQQPGVWGNATPTTPSANGMGGNQNWDATSLPQQSAASAQDAWAQSQQPSPQQPGTPAWGMQNNMPAQQQAPTAYGGNSSPNVPWGSTNQNQPAPVSDSWGQSAPAQQNNWGAAPLQPPTTTGGNSMSPAWQQAPGQVSGGINPGGGAGGFGAPFANNENDRTMIRSTGPQGSLGVVRVEEGKEPGRVYEVRKDELSIGRSRESDIFLEDLAVSRLHAKIVSLGSGNYALKDEGSANGTKVNGQLVNKYQSHTLQEGDRIQLGQTVLVFAKR